MPKTKVPFAFQQFGMSLLMVVIDARSALPVGPERERESFGLWFRLKRLVQFSSKELYLAAETFVQQTSTSLTGNAKLFDLKFFIHNSGSESEGEEKNVKPTESEWIYARFEWDNLFEKALLYQSTSFSVFEQLESKAVSLLDKVYWQALCSLVHF